MKPFLSEIARYYIERDHDALTNYCFVFPNKRAGVFFNHYLAEEADNAGISLIHPETITISNFVDDFTDSVSASRIEQLFILYRCYRDIMKRAGAEDPEVDFNRFSYWGDVILSDFTDVDKYLVDPAEIFKNIAELREISSNYLTDEQIEIIRRYWGDDKVPVQIADFWKHVAHNNNSTKHDDDVSPAVSFLRLWQVMYELYTSFHAELEGRGLSCQGMAYRTTVDQLKSMPIDEFPYDRYVFVGFNVLSAVEKKIFSILRDKGIGEFFWDYASPAFADEGNRATRFLKHYVNEFPQPAGAENIGRCLESSWPAIEIVGVPSVTGQTKLVSSIVAALFPESASGSDLMSTAIVLPDENLCLPIINTLPENITDVNVTMGFPLRNTSVASLISLITSMQMRGRRLSYKNTFFRDDVLAVLSHPIVRSVDSAACDSITKEINSHRLYNVPVELLLKPEFASLHQMFALVGDMNLSQDVFTYLRSLTLWLLDHVCDRYSVPVDEDAETPDDDELVPESLSPAGTIEAGFLMHYLGAIDELERLRNLHFGDLNVDMADSTVFHLVERLIAGETVSFEGRPLKGLPVMGILETRAIDFDNVIITSINENIFPRRHFSRSFIPPALRSGYGMATIEHQESISAYYFYRLITRAKKVYLLYDSRTEGVKNGEPSRYIKQLRYLYRPAAMTERNAGYRLNAPGDYVVSLTLDATRKKILHRYINETGHRRFLSASSINKFIACPMMFALSYIEGYQDNDEVKDFFDEATYGSALHQVVERMFKSQQTDDHPVVIDKGVIYKLRHSGLIDQEIARAIKSLYLGLSENDPRPLTGDALIISRIMHDMVDNMLAHELDHFDSFTFISGEQTKETRLQIADGLTINFSYTIDRVDMVETDGKKIIRVIDYKTGGDKVESTIEQLFEPKANEGRNKAILQLFLYCQAYAKDNVLPAGTVVQPMLYSFPTIGQNLAPMPLQIEKTVVTDFTQFIDPIMEKLAEKLLPLFTGGDDFTFVCSDDGHACKYCKFTTICMK